MSICLECGKDCISRDNYDSDFVGCAFKEAGEPIPQYQTAGNCKSHCNGRCRANHWSLTNFCRDCNYFRARNEENKHLAKRGDSTND